MRTGLAGNPRCFWRDRPRSSLAIAEVCGRDSREAKPKDFEVATEKKKTVLV